MNAAVTRDTSVMVAFHGVERDFDGVRALAPITLTVSRGEFVSIIGPSGCGKSTLLRLAARLDAPTAGVIDIATENIGFVFQDATLMPWRSVRRNIELLGELAGTPRASLATEAQRAIETVGLDDFADHLPRELSGGMRMRASLARSLVLKPELFLFDEPFGSLDEITREQLNIVLMELFLKHTRLRRETGNSVHWAESIEGVDERSEEHRFAGVFVTHSVEESVFLSTRIVVLSARPGRVVADIAVPFKYPRSLDLRYTAEFAALAGRVAETLEGAL